MGVHAAVGETLVPQKLFCCEPKPISCLFEKCPAPGERGKSFTPPRSYSNYHKYGKIVKRKKKTCISETISFAALSYFSERHLSVFEPKTSFPSS